MELVALPDGAEVSFVELLELARGLQHEPGGVEELLIDVVDGGALGLLVAVEGANLERGKLGDAAEVERLLERDAELAACGEGGLVGADDKLGAALGDKAAAAVGHLHAADAEAGVRGEFEAEIHLDELNIRCRRDLEVEFAAAGVLTLKDEPHMLQAEAVGDDGASAGGLAGSRLRARVERLLAGILDDAEVGLRISREGKAGAVLQLHNVDGVGRRRCQQGEEWQEGEQRETAHGVPRVRATEWSQIVAKQGWKGDFLAK